MEFFLEFWCAYFNTWSWPLDWFFFLVTRYIFFNIKTGLTWYRNYRVIFLEKSTFAPLTGFWYPTYFYNVKTTPILIYLFQKYRLCKKIWIFKNLTWVFIWYFLNIRYMVLFYWKFQKYSISDISYTPKKCSSYLIMLSLYAYEMEGSSIDFT